MMTQKIEPVIQEHAENDRIVTVNLITFSRVVFVNYNAQTSFRETVCKCCL